MIYLECKLWKTLPTGHRIYVTADGEVLKTVPKWRGNSKNKENAYDCVTVGCYNESVHRMVADCYLEKPEDETLNQIDHIDGNKQNNNYKNLEWVTARENMKRSYKNSLHKGLKVMCVETGDKFLTCGEASRHFRKDTSMSEGIRQCIRGKNKTCGGLHWKEWEL